MRNYQIKVRWPNGMEVIDVEAKDSVEALAKLTKILKAKQRRRGYNTIVGIDFI